MKPFSQYERVLYLIVWKVRFFQTPRGDIPVKKFIKEQNGVTYAKILHAIVLLQNGGPFLKPPQMKKLGKNLYELRITGKIQIRIFYTFFQNEYHLLHAFKKKSQKTLTREMKTALDRIKEII